MPFVDYGDTRPDLGVREAVDLNPEQKPVDAATDPSFLSTMGAAFRRENEVVSLYSSETAGLDRYVKEDDFDPIAEVRGTKYEARVEEVADIFNRRYFDAWKRQADREEEDQRTLDAAGWASLPAAAIAGLVSPTILAPGGALVRGARGGYSVLRTSASVAAAAGAVTAGQEAILQASQQTRTGSETAFNIGGSIVFGGLLGGGVAKLMSSAEQRAAVSAIDAHRKAAMEGTSLTPVADEVEAVTARQMASMGAAASDVPEIEGLSPATRTVEAYASTLQRMNPLLRALHSPSAVSRNIMLGMMDNPIYLKMNMEGRTLGPAVETVMKQYTQGAYGGGLTFQRRMWKDSRAAGLKMTYKEFDRAVAQAARRNDVGENDFVSRAAANWRSALTEPLTREAQEVKLLPDKLGNEFGESYLHRIYNQRKIVAQEPEFRAAIRPYVGAALDRSLQEDARKLGKRVDALQSEIDELETGILRRQSEFHQREAGHEIDLDDGLTERDVVSMIRQVQSGLAPKRPQSLLGWLSSKGLYDPTGELAGIGITNRTRPGLVRRMRSTSWGPKQGGGLSLDDAAQAAWDEGFFPGMVERPTIRELLDAIDDDFRGIRQVVREADIEAGNAAQRIADVQAALSRMGVDVKSPRFGTSDDMRGFATKVNAALEGIDRQRIADLKAKLDRTQGERDQMADAFVSPDDRTNYVESILNDVLEKLKGMQIADDAANLVAEVQGPLKERTLRVPDHVLEPWLEDSMETIQKRYARKMAADVGLTRKYGSAKLEDQQIDIRSSYEDLRQGVVDEKRLAELQRAEASDQADLAFVRDALRGNLNVGRRFQTFNQILRAAQTYTYMAAMGGVTISSLADAVSPAVRHGMERLVGDAVLPLMTNLRGVKLVAADSKKAGVITERAVQARIATLAEVTEPYAQGTAFERFLENIANKFTTLTGLNHWTDFAEMVSSTITQARLLDNATKGFDKLDPREQAYMAYLGLDADMTRRVAAQFKLHGGKAEGVRYADVDAWSDPVARRAYLAAITKDVNATIATKGVGDLPVWTTTPIGQAVIQFKGFSLAANQRILMRGLQEDRGRLMGGIAGMMAVGMFQYWLSSQLAGREISDNPGTWIAEGLDRSGLFAIAFEVNNMAEKTGGFGVYGAAAAAGQFFSPEADNRPPASRYATRNIPSALMGPTFGLATDAISLLALSQKARTDLYGITEGASDVAPSDIQTIRRVTPYASLPYWRWLIDGGFKGLGWQEATGFEGIVPELKKAVE